MNTSIAPRNPSLTIGIPLYNEEDNVAQLLSRLSAVVNQLEDERVSTEAIFVDDGSDDRTLVLLEEAAATFPWVKYIQLSRNFGHQAALSSIFDIASSDVLITLDGDLQDPPEVVPELYHRIKQGYDVVYVYRKTRENEPIRTAMYALYYRLLKLFWRIPVQLDSGDFAAYSRRAFSALRKMREQHKFHRGLRSWIGFSQDSIGIDRPKRYAGKSKYSTWKLISLALDGIFAFSVLPIRFALVLGLILLLLASGLMLYFFVVYSIRSDIPSSFSVLAILVFITSGINFVFLGIMGEYVGRIYEQVKGRPSYIIASHSVDLILPKKCVMEQP